MHRDDIALITGISGQDGLILAKKLLSGDVKVYGTTRQKNSDTLARLSSQGILNPVQLYELDLLNRTSVEEFLSRIKPTSIYNFGSMSSVGTSIQNPVGARVSIEFPTDYILNWIKDFNPETIFFLIPVLLKCLGTQNLTQMKIRHLRRKAHTPLLKLFPLNLANNFDTMTISK